MGNTLFLNKRRNRQFICLLTLLFLLCQYAGAQTSRVVEIPFNYFIKAIDKDKNGLMWIGTEAGIRTYDGYQYQTTGSELDSLPVNCLMMDTARNLVWAGTNKGVYAINYITQSVQKKYPGTSPIQSLLKSDKRGLVFAVEENGALWMIAPKGKTTRVNVPQLANPYHPVHSHKMIVEDGDDLIFFTPALDNVIWRMSLKTNKITRQATPYLKNPFSIEAYGNLLILGSWGYGIKLVDKYTFADKTYPVLDSLNMRYGRINTPQCCLSGDMLFVFFSGAPVWRINLKTGKGDEFWNTTYSVINRNKENPFYVDPYQTLWIGQSSGMISIQNDNNWFEKILSQYPGLVFRPSVRQIIEDANHDLFVGSYSGLFHYSAKQNEWKLYDTIQRGDEKIRSFQEGLLDDDKNGYVYIASDHFYRFNKKKHVFENDFYQLVNSNKPDDELRALCLIRDSHGKIWIGGEKGLAFYEEHTQKVILQKNNNFDIGGFRINYFYQPADKNQIWMGTEDGLYHMDIDKGIQKKINTKSHPALSNDLVYCITEDHKGNVWLATEGGINILAPSGKHIRYINAGNSSLCNSVVYGLLWENDNELWISTQKGLCNYSLLDGSFTNYFESDGLCNNEFNRNSLLKDHNGKFYFGGIGGVTAFYPEKISKLPASNQVFVSSVSIWDSYSNKDVLYKANKADGSEIIMDYDEKALTISMGLSDYTAAGNNTFLYRISGLYNDEWISLGNQHKLRLERLAAGSYRLELKGVNARGVASQNIIHYNLFIKKPYYQSAWFYALIFFACVGIIYIIFLNRYMNLKSLKHQRVQIASDLHDEIGGLITRITIYASSVKEGYLNTEETKSRLDKITSISRSLSGAVRDVLWSIDARNDMTSNLSDYMNEHVQSQIRYTDIKLTFEVKDADRNAKITAYARQQLYRIFKESINNIMKHSKPTYIKVYYSHNAKGFTLHIENDGVPPVDPERKSKSSGQGTKNIQMRASRINAIAETERQGDRYFVRVQSRKQSFWRRFLRM